jgi:hypothetical protein
MVLRAHIRYHLGEIAEGCPTAWCAPALAPSHHHDEDTAGHEVGSYFG